MPLPTSSAGLFRDAINVRPLRVTLDAAALGDAFRVLACVGCGAPSADRKVTLKVPMSFPSVGRTFAAFVVLVLALFGSVGVFIGLSAALWRSFGVPERVAFTIGGSSALLVLGGAVGVAVYLARTKPARLELGRCRSCRRQAVAGALRMAGVVLLLVVAPMAAAAAAVKGFQLTDGMALVTMLSGTGTSVVLCVLLHPHVWEHLVFAVHAEWSPRGIRLVGGPKLAEVIAAERPDVVADVEVLGRVTWRRASRRRTGAHFG